MVGSRNHAKCHSPQSWHIHMASMWNHMGLVTLQCHRADSLIHWSQRLVPSTLCVAAHALLSIELLREFVSESLPRAKIILWGHHLFRQCSGLSVTGSQRFSGSSDLESRQQDPSQVAPGYITLGDDWEMTSLKYTCYVDSRPLTHLDCVFKVQVPVLAGILLPLPPQRGEFPSLPQPHVATSLLLLFCLVEEQASAGCLYFTILPPVLPGFARGCYLAVGTKNGVNPSNP